MHKNLEKATKSFKSLDTVQDLTRAGITYSDYLEIACSLQSLENYGTAETVCFNVAQWFIKHGAKVEPSGIGCKITF